MSRCKVSWRSDIGGSRRDLLALEAFGEMGASDMALGKEAVASACQSDGNHAILVDGF